MIDFILGAYLTGMVIRGWLRGFVKELVDLVGLVLGIILAFRLSGPLGDFIADRFGTRPELARLGAGVALFILVGMALSVLAFWVGKVMRLPGLNLVNRLFGAGVAVAWGIALILVVVSLLRAFDGPAVVEEAVDDSTIVAAVAGSDAVPQRVFQSLAGDDVLDTLLALKPLLGRDRVVLEEGQTLEIEAVNASELAEHSDDAVDVYDRVNLARAEAGVDPLNWSDDLAAVALGHAFDMYTHGFVSHTSPTTGSVLERVQAAGVRMLAVGENLALAASSRAVHQGLMESPGHRANILRPEFDTLGVAAVRGPLGLMVVEVFADR